MKLTKKQFAKIERLMPITRKPAEISSYQFLCALLCMIENGCKWRTLPKRYGKWHTIYMRFNRWSKNGTIQKVFEKMQKMNIIDIRTDVLCIDQSIGRSKGGWQRSYIFAVLLIDMRLFFTCLPEIIMMLPRAESLLKQSARRIITIFSWIEHMKMTKLVL